MGWPGIVALAAAFGIVQAGVVDQSLFSESYREIEYWDEILRPTFIAPLGFGGRDAMNFIAGHVIWSFCIPIALVESLCPALSGRPWLRRPGLARHGVAVPGSGRAGPVRSPPAREGPRLGELRRSPGRSPSPHSWRPSPFTVGRRRPPARDAAVPKPLVVGVLSLIAALAFDFMPPSWPGVAAGLAVLAAGVVAIARVSRSAGWGGRHVVALATARSLLARAIVGFFAVPLGNEAAAFAARFFKTGPGQYGEGDVFLGIRVPVIASSLRRTRPLGLDQAIGAAAVGGSRGSPARLADPGQASLKGRRRGKKRIYDLYLVNTRFVNNWDLVDVSAPTIVGGHLVETEPQAAGSAGGFEESLGATASRSSRLPSSSAGRISRTRCGSPSGCSAIERT